MKEVYVSPVLNILCFAPVERLAKIEVDEYGNVVGGSSVKASGASADVEVDLTIGSTNGEGNPFD